MSAGIVHTKASLMLAGTLGIAAVVRQSPLELWYAVGALVGVMVTPDCDVDNGTIHGKYLRQRLGRAAEFVWDAVWFMYRRSLKHGGELSHFPIISTLGRVVYLYFFVIVLPTVVLSTLFQLDVVSELRWWANQIIHHWRVVVGLMCSDLIHWVLDILTTEHGTKRKSKTKLLGKGKNSRGKGVLGVARRFAKQGLRLFRGRQ